MLIFQVGGSIRDELLGFDASDKDFVIVNATVDEFLLKFPDAKQIGSSFPVFMVKGSEYAFARKEKKISPGYKGFEVESNPEITIEEDLFRRDITINAIARNVETGEIIDPFNGRKDLENKVIVHISDAFAEDPLRVYRVARFASRFYDFSVDSKTMEMMASLKNELQNLSQERVWQESVKALSTGRPSRFFKILKECSLLDVHFAEIFNLLEVPAGPEKYHPGEVDTFDHTMKALDRISDYKGTDPVLAFSVLCHDFGKAQTKKELYPHHHGHDRAGEKMVKEFCKRMKIPNKFVNAAFLSSKYHMMLPKIMEMRPAKALSMLEKLKTFPAGQIEGFLRVLYADSGEYPQDLEEFIKKVTPALEEKLPEKWWNLGGKSTQILNQLKAEKYLMLKNSR